LIHSLVEFYKKLYTLRKKISKQDRHGIYTKLDLLTLETITTSIKASFEPKAQKSTTLQSLRIIIETLKRMTRLAMELGIVTQKRYLELEQNLQEASKMTNGWIRYINGKNRTPLD